MLTIVKSSVLRALRAELSKQRLDNVRATAEAKAARDELELRRYGLVTATAATAYSHALAAADVAIEKSLVSRRLAAAEETIRALQAELAEARVQVLAGRGPVTADMRWRTLGGALVAVSADPQWSDPNFDGYCQGCGAVWDGERVESARRWAHDHAANCRAVPAVSDATVSDAAVSDAAVLDGAGKAGDHG